MRLYRAALRAYPAAYRHARGAEILATLEELHSDAQPSPGELAALVRAGLGERDRLDGGAGTAWRLGLAALVLPLAAVNAAIALTGLWIAHDGGSGRWWPAYALAACALAVAAAARLPVALPALGLVNIAFLAGDAAVMAGDGGGIPHIRLFERAYAGEVWPATVPSNPTELVPLALVLAAGAFVTRPAPGHRVLRTALTLGCAASLAALAVALPDHRFALLLPGAVAFALASLVLGAVYRRALATGAALVAVLAPSVFWYLTRGFPFEHAELYGLAAAPLQRDVTAGLVAVAALAGAGLVAALAGRAAAAR